MITIILTLSIFSQRFLTLEEKLSIHRSMEHGETLAAEDIYLAKTL